MTQADGAADPDRSRLESHWRDIGGSRDIPRRTDIDPASIATCLDRMMLLERIAPRQVRIRLAGQRVSGLMAHDPRGMPLTALMVPPSRDWLGDCIEALFDEPARMELGLVGPRSALRPRHRASLLLLPLRDRAGEITRAVGFLTLPSRTPNGSVRFEICGETRRRLQIAGSPAQSSERRSEEAQPKFDAADHARDVLRRRQNFHVVN